MGWQINAQGLDQLARVRGVAETMSTAIVRLRSLSSHVVPSEEAAIGVCLSRRHKQGGI